MPRLAVFRSVLLAVAAATCLSACQKAGAPAAQAPAPADVEAQIRANLAKRLPQLPAIAEVRASPIAGVYELRVGEADVLYVDAQGDYLIRGAILETQTRKDMTQERIDALTAVDFASLPLADAFTVQRGDGKRHLAVFEDPRCPYCHQFEQELAQVDNVTIHTFIMPILGPESVAVSQALWCAPDKAKAWSDWMLHQTQPSAPKAACDTGALERNVAFGRRHNITGTPALLFTNGKRAPGAIPAADIDRMLDEALASNQ